MYVLEKSIIPMPKKIEDRKERIELGIMASGAFTVVEESEDVLLTEGVNILLRDIFDKICAKPITNGYKITVKIDGSDKAFEKIASDEAYYIDVNDDGATLCAKTDKGAFYACITMKRLIYAEGDRLYLHKAYILDYPDYSRRGHSIETRYGTDRMTKKDWFDLLDRFAEDKINMIYLGIYNCWGVQYDDAPVEYLYVPFKKYPKLKTPKIIKYYSVKEKKWISKTELPPMFCEDFLEEVIAYGKKRNIMVVPRLASLSHNTLFPRLMPELAPIMEDGTRGTSGFCTSNPKTYEFLFSIFDEVIDRFIAPFGHDMISAGLDELGKGDICHCDKCKNLTPYDMLMNHIITCGKYLKSRGIKTMRICHDMLLKYDDKFEDMKSRFIEADIYDTMLVGWWEYHVPDSPVYFSGKKDKVEAKFRSEIAPITGYFNWAIPQDNNENIRDMARLGMEKGFEACIAYSSPDRCCDKNFSVFSDCAWNVEAGLDKDLFDERYAYINYPENLSRALMAFRSLVPIMENDLRTSYMNRMFLLFDPYWYSYRHANMESPQNFPGRAFRAIRDNEREILSYLEKNFENATAALEFFDNSGKCDAMNDIWRITSMQYKYRADEYMTLYRLDKKYNTGIADAYEVIRELERILINKERLMALVEDVKTPAEGYTLLRNLSTERQYMLDLLNYFKKEISAQRKPKLDVFDLTYVTGKTLDFLR